MDIVKKLRLFKKGSHRFLNFKIKEKRGDLRRNFQIFDEQFEKKQRRIEEILRNFVTTKTQCT